MDLHGADRTEFLTAEAVDAGFSVYARLAAFYRDGLCRADIRAFFAADAVLRAQLREGREHMELHAVGKSGKRPLSAAAEKDARLRGDGLVVRDRKRGGIAEKLQPFRAVRAQAAPVVEQFDRMCAQAYQDIRSPALRLGISVALVPSYLPMLGDVLEQFRQQYPGIPLETTLLSNDAVCAQLQNGTLDAGLVMDLGGCAAGLARTALTRHTAALLVPRCSPFWGRSSIAPAELDGQLLLVPGLAPEPLAPLWNTLAGARPKVEIGEQYYQVLYRTQERNGLALDRLEITSDHSMDNVQDVALDGMPPICAAFLQPEPAEHPCVRLLCSFLQEHLRNL